MAKLEVSSNMLQRKGEKIDETIVEIQNEGQNLSGRLDRFFKEMLYPAIFNQHELKIKSI
jgi:hypothetical protein